MPANWPEVVKTIDNLAELKVVQLVLWVTWGNGYPDDQVPLSTEDFMEVTGLCKRSVANGIKKALEHGYISRKACKEDSTVCFYGIQLAQTELDAGEQDMSCQEDFDWTLMQDFPDDDANFTLAPEQDLPCENFAFMPETALQVDSDYDANFTLSRELEISTQSYYSEDISRIQEDDNNFDSGRDALPCARQQLLSQADNATLCSRMEGLSNALGDVEHTASNIGQARHILAEYQAHGGNFEAFLLLLWEARDLARKKTNMRRPNRMPYFFACLKRACLPRKEQAIA